MDGNREWKSSYIFFYSKCSFQSITPIFSIYKHSHTIFLKLNEVIPARYIIHYTGILFLFFLWKFLLRTSQQRSREWNATWNGSDNSSFLKRNANLSTASQAHSISCLFHSSSTIYLPLSLFPPHYVDSTNCIVQLIENSCNFYSHQKPFLFVGG